MAPSRWYHTGFLAPEQDRDQPDPTKDEEATASKTVSKDEPQEAEPEPKKPKIFPASMGLSLLLPAQASAVEVLVDFADYIPVKLTDLPKEVQAEAEARSTKVQPWQRVPQVCTPFTVSLAGALCEDGVPVPNTVGLYVVGRVEAAEIAGVPEGTQALSLFVVNRRPRAERSSEQDRQFIFQVRLQVTCAEGIVPRPDLTGVSGREWDELVADLQFRGVYEYAVGHGVAVRVPGGQSLVTCVETTFLPRYEVTRVKPRESDAELHTAMSQLMELRSAEDVRRALSALPQRYREWIDEQRSVDVSAGVIGDADALAMRRSVQHDLMEDAQRACARIEEGIALLAEDAQVRLAFALANRAMREQARQRNWDEYKDKEPRWRLFQLAFLLLCLPSLCNAEHPHRRDVELIFFPTGGGKTEAYLGVIATCLLLRRLRGVARPDGGLGVAVILRYTLRLLTLDQMDRAATLICALELLRKADEARLGTGRFSIGLWVGSGATANRLADAAKQVSEYKDKGYASPCPLTVCPWCCRAPLSPSSFRLLPSLKAPERLVTACTDFRCAFSERNAPQGLPISFVDEQVYSELPSFILATVDKFATVPYRGPSGKLFGKVRSRVGDRFFGAADGKAPKGAVNLADGLLPPELIVQDELHLISGPLGTMVGLYETAIDWLCTRTGPDGKPMGPKILASTATVRNAGEQIAALYGRAKNETRVFPPPGIDDGETFFATLDHDSPGRLYVGVAATGRAMKASLLRTYVNVLMAGNWLLADAKESGEAERLWAADQFMTVAGYFNSLRELGGMRRLVEDDARVRARGGEERAPLDVRGRHPYFRNRELSLEPLELTSRESTDSITRAKQELSTPYVEQDPARDVLLASNMISVGVDIARLGVMVVAGQPKTTAEYIQASSRVGRSGKAAGLVITCLNPAKARDRSHFERFGLFHECFYRHVEATSVTPFSIPALERGLAGTLVAMARFAVDALSPNEGATLIAEHRRALDAAVEALAARADHMPGHDGTLGEAVKDRAEHLLDVWEKRMAAAKADGTKRGYSKPKPKAALMPLLRDPLSDDYLTVPEERDFSAPHSMRDVERSVPLWVSPRLVRT